jgi:hypothetical protein
LFDAGYLPADFSIGPVVRARRMQVAYGNAPRLAVLTSGRYFERAGMANPDDSQANTDRPYRIYRSKGSGSQDPSMKERQAP